MSLWGVGWDLGEGIARVLVTSGRLHPGKKAARPARAVDPGRGRASIVSAAIVPAAIVPAAIVPAAIVPAAARWCCFILLIDDKQIKKRLDADRVGALC